MSPTSPTIEVTKWNRADCCPGKKINTQVHHTTPFTLKDKRGKTQEGSKLFTSETECFLIVETHDQIIRKIEDAAPKHMPAPRTTNDKTE